MPLFPNLLSLQSRVLRAEQLFLDLCQRPLFEHLFGDSSWAIVGGAVRDTLLGPEKDLDLPIPWPDIDICVAHLIDLLPAVQAAKTDEFRVERNYYGGLKVFTKDLGVIDVWDWIGPDPKDGSVEAWTNRLANVDFGLNALAFVWPLGKIVAHPQWIADYQQKQVELLADPAKQRGIQALRSIALATKVGAHLQEKIGLGLKAREELSWLVDQAPVEQVEETQSYLQQKVKTGRWAKEVEMRFLEECQGKQK